MNTIAEVIEAAARPAVDGRSGLNAPPALQSWPGIVHGGAVVALLDAAAGALGVTRGPRVLEGRLTSSLPLECDLDLDAEPWEDGVTLTARRDGQTLSSGTIRPLPAGDGIAAPWAGGGDGARLPMSDDCLACGARNPLGLRVALRFDDDGVWARVTPGPAWRAPGDRLHPALPPVLLDEVSWWLGALVAREGGLTNRIDVAMVAPDAPWGEPLIAAGRFADVTAVDRKRTFWRARTALATARGDLLATGSVVFRGGADYSARQLPYFRSRTGPDAFRRMFPNHVERL